MIKYMITLAFLFIFLLSVSIAALTVPPAKQEALLRASWQRLGNQTKDELQVAGNCCGFHVLADLTNTTMSHPPCVKVSFQTLIWHVDLVNKQGTLSYLALLCC